MVEQSYGWRKADMKLHTVFNILPQYRCDLQDMGQYAFSWFLYWSFNLINISLWEWIEYLHAIGTPVYGPNKFTGIEQFAY